MRGPGWGGGAENTKLWWGRVFVGGRLGIIRTGGQLGPTHKIIPTFSPGPAPFLNLEAWVNFNLEVNAFIVARPFFFFKNETYLTDFWYVTIMSAKYLINIIRINNSGLTGPAQTCKLCNSL